MNYYMHTLDGQPAYAEKRPGNATAIVYAGRYVGQLATSLEQIRQEQRASAQHYGPNDNAKYGYVRIPAHAVSRSGKHE